MDKTNDMALTIEELRSAVAAINEVANRMVRVFGNEAFDEEAPTVKPAMKLEKVRAVLAEKSRNGYTAQIQSLLQKYGADRLSQLDPTKYAALLADVEVLRDAT
ncbi:MAG: DNA ligase [Clostridiaceae bacterium]